MSDVIAFLGTGLMGAPMTRRLLRAGFTVRAWNRSIAKAAPLRDVGAIVVDTPEQAARGAKAVCLCLTDEAAVEQVMFGGHGAADALEDDAVIADFSTIGPTATLKMGQRLASVAPGACWIDAPVTGGVKGAESGELVVLCGGDSNAIRRILPVLEAISRRISVLGPSGCGQAAKLCNQLIVTVNVIAIAEALALGRSYGLNIKSLPAALEGSWADSAPLQIIGRRMAEGISEPVAVAIDTFAKDLRLVLSNEAKPSSLAGEAEKIYQNALVDGLGDKDAACLLQFIEQRFS